MQNRAIKLIIVGSSGVGKTSLLYSLQKKQLNNTIAPTISPSSFNAKIKVAPEQYVTLEIWDTAGQEKYKSISKMFYRDSDICFVVYDHTTADSVKDWIESVREEVPDVIPFLIQTKSDLISDDLAINVERGKDLKREFNFREYFLVSSVTGQRVNDAFLSAALLEQEVLDKSTLQVKEVLKSKKQKSCC